MLCFAQQEVTGKVTDSDNNPLIGVNIIEKGTSNGTASDFDGNYKINVPEDATLIFSSVGYGSKNIKVNGQSTVNVAMDNGEKLEEVIVVGSRTAPRSSSDTPLPVDVLPSKALASTGQASFDKALQYRIPSFNTVQTPVNDATSLLDPYEIRNMGPSRTLILINGKRKNLSALLYTQTAPGRGETGADISAIPTDAIKRVEILRDGASAQYGSDAIAGVMNIILKDNAKPGSATLRTGITSKGDGESIGFSVNNGTSTGNNNGFVNYTIDLSKTNLANRPGTVSAGGEAADFGADINVVKEFLSRRPDAGNVNGSPENAAAKFLINSGVDLNEDTEMYFNSAYVYKKVNSFANYRTPYWRTLADYPYLADFFPSPGTPNNYDGYVPTFDGNLSDYNGTIGIKSKINDWNVDLSFTTGGNKQTYTVRNTHNGNDSRDPDTYLGDLNNNGTVDITPYDADNNGEISDNEGVELIQGDFKYKEKSPLNFDPGGTRFSHNVGNIDISRILSDKVSIGLGTEFRTENFEIIEGDKASYEGGGADSFSGNAETVSGKFNRYNLGAYFSLDYDVSDDFLVSGTARFENFSDFGDAFVYKASTRYKLGDFALRASYSTGFRAPTLHQIYTQKEQYAFVAGEGIQVGGLFNNVSPEARLLGVPQLEAEKSQNFTIGFGGKVNKNLSFTVDYYNIAVKDRIFLSTEIGKAEFNDPNNPAAEPSKVKLNKILKDKKLKNISFFANALDTRTAGIDFVTSYKGLELGEGKLDINLSGNYTLQNERVGEVRTPKLVAETGQSVVNDTQESYLFTSRPQTKWILGGNYTLDKFTFSLNNTYFGKTQFELADMSEDLTTEFIPKIVTDLGVTYDATEKLNIALNINNLLDILPEWKFVAENEAGAKILSDTSVNEFGLTPKEVQSNLATFNQRYSQMTYNGSHFSQLGTMMSLSLNYKF